MEATLILGRAVREIDHPPPVWVQMSTAHLYGDPPQAWCDEDSAFGYGLAPFVGKAWERAFHQSTLPEMRQVIFRTSFVLGKKGGALKRLALLTRLGLGGKVSNGRQGISWIHEADLNRLFHKAITNPKMQGAYIASAPHPVSNKVFMKTLRQAMRIPLGLPATAWMAQWGAHYLMNTDPELALFGRYCVSKRLQAEGFAFQFPGLTEALNDLFR